MKREMMKPSTLAVAGAVGRVTFLEIIRDKVLYNILVCCFLLFGVGYLASKLTFIQPERVTLDFGFTAVTLSCSFIAIFTGAGLIGREFERRTIYVALCHPISRAQFILGKFVGLATVLFLNWALLSFSYVLILGSSEGGRIFLCSILFIALFLALIQSFVLSSLAILFSCFSTTSLAVIFSIGFYLIGNTISQMRLIIARIPDSFKKTVLNWITNFLPNLEYFNYGLKVTYGLPLSGKVVCISVLYGFFVIALLLLFAGLLIQSREV